MTGRVTGPSVPLCLCVTCIRVYHHRHCYKQPCVQYVDTFSIFLDLNCVLGVISQERDLATGYRCDFGTGQREKAGWEMRRRDLVGSVRR